MIWDRFRRTRDDVPAPAAPADDVEAVEQDEEEPEALPEQSEETPWSERALAVIPGGSSTGSKRVAAIYGDSPLDATLPTHYVRARGASLFLADGERELEVVDCTMALGSVAIGYADDHVVSSVVRAISLGHVGGMPSVLEVAVAERLGAFVSCAERVRFVKTGAEAVSAAVRIARTYTGRSTVVHAGYLGWHDWAAGEDVAGVPREARAKSARIPFDDVAALERAVSAAGSDLAAIVLEPVVEREPSREWLERARALADRAGAVLVFDEIKTGFRIRPGGYHEACGITPDLATYGKALANGFPLAAVVGRSDVMDAATRTWISSTLAGETGGLAAANAVLDWHEREDVCARLASIGAAMRAAVHRAVDAAGIPGIATFGLDQMWGIRFEDAATEELFVRYAVEEGALFKRGAYNFAAIAHEDVIDDIESAASGALVAIREGGRKR
ncbi:MAG TPA: aminotransferase class III-fold pyridoxal phosphate-dependent enzyme [Gemmatimonadaceae bacterium]|nr:aminotransferase class III-fold pyridoxal phosphate-dependent enzyme [Gemmatimonadaceae bacterium]